MRTLRFTLVSLSALVAISLISLPPTATTIYVPDGQPTIQAGIEVASSGDTVLVACGTYYEDDIHVNPSITLRSVTGQADWVIIDAQYQHGVMVCLNVTGDTRIEGLTITHGFDEEGGGVYCSNSSPTLANVRFSSNDVGSWGAGCTAPTAPLRCWRTASSPATSLEPEGVLRAGATPTRFSRT